MPPPPPRSTLFPYTTLFRSYLARAGVRTVVIERDAIGSHASGFAYGGLNPLSGFGIPGPHAEIAQAGDRKSTRLNSSHQIISYAVFCLKKKKKKKIKMDDEK